MKRVIIKVKVPRKLKKEKNKIEIRCYPHVKDKNGFLKEEVVILPNVKVNKWTFKLVSKLKKELEKRNKYMWKEVCEEFLNPNKINKNIIWKIRRYRSMKSTILTDKDKELISQIVCDDATGNHLLGRKRQEGYWEMRKEIIEAENSKALTERQTNILEYYKQSSDYAYYQSLPIEKRMF